MITAQWREAQDRWWTCTEEGFLTPTTEVKFIGGSCLFPQVLLCPFLEQYSLFRSMRTTSLFPPTVSQGHPEGISAICTDGLLLGWTSIPTARGRAQLCLCGNLARFSHWGRQGDGQVCEKLYISEFFSLELPILVAG